MAAARTSIVVTLLAVVLLVASVQASGGRTLLTSAYNLCTFSAQLTLGHMY